MQECLYTLHLPVEEFCCLLNPLNVVVVTAMSTRTVFRDPNFLISWELWLSAALQLQGAEIKFV